MEQEALTAFAAGLRGSAISPADAEYDDARRVWNGTIDKKPALIVRCAGTADVIAAVNFAREQGLAVSVRGGGHHVAGSAILEDGLVIDLSQMRSVRVDPVAKTVRAEGGAQIGDVDHEAQALGLAVPMGVFAETGIGGITLAGGLGWLRRKLGMSCDTLVSADVVTADGQLLSASATQNEDLFWALHGGGWDMGVVTSFEYAAQPLGPEVFFTFVAYPIEEAVDVLKKLRAWMATAPDGSSPIAIIWTFASAEPYPEEVWGKTFVGVAGPYFGSVEEGERLQQPLRELGTPLMDLSGPMPFEIVQHLFDEEYPKGRHYYWKSVYLKDIEDGAIEKLVELGKARPSPLSSLDIWTLGGAIGRVGATDTPINNRDAGYLIGIEANWDEAADDAANIAWTRGVEAAMQPYSNGAPYLNFADLNESEALSKSLGANYTRLQAIKQKYDPSNLFRSRGTRA